MQVSCVSMEPCLTEVSYVIEVLCVTMESPHVAEPDKRRDAQTCCINQNRGVTVLPGPDEQCDCEGACNSLFPQTLIESHVNS